jgi:hypothetical protein
MLLVLLNNILICFFSFFGIDNNSSVIYLILSINIEEIHLFKVNLLIVLFKVYFSINLKFLRF